MATQQQGAAAEGQPKDVSSTSTDQTAAMMQLFASSQAMAQMMTQQPPPQQPRFEEGTGPVKWLLVGGLLHPDTTEDELIERFSELGRVENVKLIAGKNCGFIKFEELEAAIRAHETMHGAFLHKHTIKIGWAKTDPFEEKGPVTKKSVDWEHSSRNNTRRDHKSILSHLEALRLFASSSTQDMRVCQFSRPSTLQSARKQE